MLVLIHGYLMYVCNCMTMLCLMFGKKENVINPR